VRQSVKVTGLREVRRTFAKLGDKTTVHAAFKAEGRAIAEHVLARVRVEAALTGRREIVRAASTIKPSNTVAGAALRAGGKWELPALFGAHHDRPRIGPSGREYRGLNQFTTPQRDGGPIYRAIARERGWIETAYMDAIERIANT
jgi:hypothetical protein